ncbi:MAG: HlyD family efflux transporter periplasmic adaptor subunit [Cyclobacteriaceae bacterium]
MAIMFLFSWLIRYPDQIEGKIVLTTPEPPIAIVAQSEGYLENLQVVNRDTLQAGALLGIIQNTASYPDIERLQQLLNGWKANQHGWINDSSTLPDLQLGSLQQYYSNLQQARQAYLQHTQWSLHQQERHVLKEQQAYYQVLLTQKQAEKQLAQQMARLAAKDFHRNKDLYESQTIAERALEESEHDWLESKQTTQALSSEIAELQLSQQKLSRELIHLENHYLRTEANLQNTMKGAIVSLQVALQRWERDYVLRAPVSGTVSGNKYHHNYIQRGDTILHILPTVDQPVIGHLQVPVQDFGKIKKGQKVRIYLDQYPHQEFGRLQGEIVEWTVLPNHEYYQVTVQISDSLTTQYGKNISFQQHLSGRAEIITHSKRLLERIFHTLRKTTL